MGVIKFRHLLLQTLTDIVNIIIRLLQFDIHGPFCYSFNMLMTWRPRASQNRNLLLSWSWDFQGRELSTLRSWNSVNRDLSNDLEKRELWDLPKSDSEKRNLSGDVQKRELSNTCALPLPIPSSMVNYFIHNLVRLS